MSEPQTCPRRMNEWGPWERKENLDTWRADDSCSFCGSYNPVRLLEDIKAHRVILGPTDKNYKVYVDHKDEKSRFNKCYFQHFTEEQMQEFVELYNNKPPVIEISGGDFYVLPFFMRRSEGRVG